MNDRHTAAIKFFPKPNSVPQLQSFLGLSNYFRKFIRNYAQKAKPLYNLFKKSVKFDQNCIEAFESLKVELTKYPILRLYNSAAQTELHTDASSIGLGDILLQKQSDNKWRPLHILTKQRIRPKQITTV